jgi:hypothetical protein
VRGQRGLALPHAGVFRADIGMDSARRLAPDFNSFRAKEIMIESGPAPRLTPRRFVRPEPRGPGLSRWDRPDSAGNLEKARSLRMR